MTSAASLHHVIAQQLASLLKISTIKERKTKKSYHSFVPQGIAV
jgi:hypothetical protein